LQSNEENKKNISFIKPHKLMNKRASVPLTTVIDLQPEAP